MEFSESVKEALGCYVYCLVDPRDNKVFYIGKGSGNRVFDHANDAMSEDNHSLKLDTIRDILNNNLRVGYYILRHNLSEKEAYIVESTLIDMLTYDAFNMEKVLTNIASGHHQWNEGIKTVEELEAIYNCEKPLDVKEKGTVLLVCINNSYDQSDAKGVYIRPNIYEATRKYWPIWRYRKNRPPQNIRYVLGVYHGIVRSVIKVRSFNWVDVADDGTKFKDKRCCFEGDMLDDSDYINNNAKASYPFGRNSIRFV